MEVKMEDRSEWNRFWLSGKVADYLKYAAKAEKGHKEAGTDTYAGFTYDDRPRSEGVPAFEDTALMTAILC